MPQPAEQRRFTHPPLPDDEVVLRRPLAPEIAHAREATKDAPKTAKPAGATSVEPAAEDPTPERPPDEPPPATLAEQLLARKKKR